MHDVIMSLSMLIFLPHLMAKKFLHIHPPPPPPPLHTMEHQSESTLLCITLTVTFWGTWSSGRTQLD